MAEISVKNLSKNFLGRKILNDINFELKENKIYGLLGRSGVGKSTLLNIMTDRILASNGTVQIDHHDVHNNTNLLQEMFLINDDDHIFPKWMKVKEIFNNANFAYGDFDFEEAHRLAEEFGINENIQLSKLSTGLKTAVKIICAFCVNAKFIFLDEPTLGLDANLRQIFYKELMHTFTKHPRTFVLATHLIEEIQNLLDEVLIVKDGILICNSTVDDLLNRVVEISGPKDEIEKLDNQLDIYYQKSIGNIQTAYVMGDTDQLKFSKNITIDHVDLQTAFIMLTREKGGH